MARKGKGKGCLGCLVFLVALGGIGWFVGNQQLSPLPKGPPRYVRFEDAITLEAALNRLEKERIVRSALATRLYAMANRKAKPIRSGTYELAPGMDADGVLTALGKPIRRMFRFPETNWAKRSANLLEKAGICTADEYMALVNDPQEFQMDVSFPLPKAGSLEGYLYPDTYDLPPLLGARGVVLRQLKAFEDKVLDGKPAPKDLHRDLIVASMVELEVMKDEERPVVAGVIENRIKLGMPLQIDAAILYGLGEWRELTFDDYRNADTPYNTYRNKGLPPGPICSPTVKSVRGAQNPAKHNYLYYVALPEGRHLFSATYSEHLRNVAKRKAAILALRQRGESQ